MSKRVANTLQQKKTVLKITVLRYNMYAALSITIDTYCWQYFPRPHNLLGSLLYCTVITPIHKLVQCTLFSAIHSFLIIISPIHRKYAQSIIKVFLIILYFIICRPKHTKESFCVQSVQQITVFIVKSLKCCR